MNRILLFSKGFLSFTGDINPQASPAGSTLFIAASISRGLGYF